MAALARLDAVIAHRERERPAGSYTTGLFELGVKRIAQKVGEVGGEAALAGVAGRYDELLGEAADLSSSLRVLLRPTGLGPVAVERVLPGRQPGWIKFVGG